MHSSSDILIIGGGTIGLALAIELKLRGSSKVTVLSRSFSEAAGHAAAGMLAPQAEALPPSPLRSLCLRSLNAYADWVSKLEDLSGLSSDYWQCGILAPVFDAAARQIHAELTPDASRFWLDQSTVHHAQPGLSPEIAGGWWYPEEGQVDTRSLMQVLKAAAEAIAVEVHEGVTVTDIQHQAGQVERVRTTQGDWFAQHYVLAAGAWAAQLLPIPLHPRKGQMMALRSPQYPLPTTTGLPLNQVLFGENIYIVPRQDGRIILGATVESVGFTLGNTVEGIQSLLNAATCLLPALSAASVDDYWWGFRPTPIDESPILGESLWDNLTLATGHHRNGILLIPATVQVLADLILEQTTDSLLPHFSWQRFLSPAASSSPNLTTIQEPQKDSSMTASIQPATPAPPQSASSLSVSQSTTKDSALVIAGRSFQSRLMTGTGKYRNFTEMQGAIAASGCQIVTVAVRRVQTNAPGHEGLAEALDWTKIWMLPNTAGCKTAEEAIRVARLGREMAKLLGQEDNNFVKLEVIPDSKYLLPDPIGTLEAAEMLVKEGFAVLPYINADPLLAKRLEEAGCATVMPLGSPIGSGQGIRNAANIEIIVENAKIPVVVDAGIGTPSEACEAMEMGADALLINTAIAQAKDPVAMGQAMGMAAVAGRLAYLAGRIPVKTSAIASSPLTGTVTS